MSVSPFCGAKDVNATCGNGIQCSVGGGTCFRRVTGLSLWQDTTMTLVYISDATASTVRAIHTYKNVVSGIVGRDLDGGESLVLGGYPSVRLRSPHVVLTDAPYGFLLTDTLAASIIRCHHEKQTCTSLVGSRGRGFVVNVPLNRSRLATPTDLFRVSDWSVLVTDPTNNAVVRLPALPSGIEGVVGATVVMSHIATVPGAAYVRQWHGYMFITSTREHVLYRVSTSHPDSPEVVLGTKGVATASLAGLNGPTFLRLDCGHPHLPLLISDTNNNRIVRWDANGVSTQAVLETSDVVAPMGMVFSNARTLLVAEQHRIVAVTYHESVARAGRSSEFCAGTFTPTTTPDRADTTASTSLEVTPTAGTWSAEGEDPTVSATASSSGSKNTTVTQSVSLVATKSVSRSERSPTVSMSASAVSDTTLVVSLTSIPGDPLTMSTRVRETTLQMVFSLNAGYVWRRPNVLSVGRSVDVTGVIATETNPLGIKHMVQRYPDRVKLSVNPKAAHELLVTIGPWPHFYLARTDALRMSWHANLSEPNYPLAPRATSVLFLATTRDDTLAQVVEASLLVAWIGSLVFAVVKSPVGLHPVMRTAIVLRSTCYEMGRQDGSNPLGNFLHLLDFPVGPNRQDDRFRYEAACLLGNCVMVVFFGGALFAAVLAMLRWKKIQGHVNATFRNTMARMRFPSTVLLVFYMFAPGIVYSASRMGLYGSTWQRYIASVVVFVLFGTYGCVAVQKLVTRTSFHAQMVPISDLALQHYNDNPTHQYLAMDPRATHWSSTDLEGDFALRWWYLFHDHRGTGIIARLAWLDFAATCLVAVVAAVEGHTATGCIVRTHIPGGIIAAFVLYIIVVRPFSVAFVGHVAVFLNAASLFVVVVSAYGANLMVRDEDTQFRALLEGPASVAVSTGLWVGGVCLATVSVWYLRHDRFMKHKLHTDDGDAIITDGERGGDVGVVETEMVTTVTTQEDVVGRSQVLSDDVDGDDDDDDDASKRGLEERDDIPISIRYEPPPSALLPEPANALLSEEEKRAVAARDELGLLDWYQFNVKQPHHRDDPITREQQRKWRHLHDDLFGDSTKKENKKVEVEVAVSESAAPTKGVTGTTRSMPLTNEQRERVKELERSLLL